MSWLLSGQLQSSLGSLKNQVANSLKEVFEAVDEDDDPQLDDPNQDPKEKVELAKGRIRELKTLLESRTADIDQLKKQNESLLHFKKSLEDQREQLKELLKDKEEEIQMLATEKSGEPNQDEIAILNNQIESLQSCLEEVKDKHRQEIQELTNSFLAQKSVTSEQELRDEIQTLQSQLEEERAKLLILEQTSKSSSAPIQNGTSADPGLEKEVHDLQECLERERLNHGKLLAEAEQEWKLKNEGLVADVDSLRRELADSRNVLFAERNESEELRKQFSDASEALKHDLAESEKRFETEKSSFETEIEALKADLRQKSCQDEQVISQLKSENEASKAGFEQKMDEMKRSLKAAEVEKSNFEKEVESLKQNLKTLEAQIGENESSQVQSLLASLQSEREKHRHELDEIAAKMTSDSERQKNELIHDFEGKINRLSQESSGARAETERIEVEKNVIEMSLEQMKLEFSKLSETVVANEKAVAEERARSLANEESNTLLSAELETVQCKLEKSLSEKEEYRQEKMLLENECSDLKEKLENLLNDFGRLKLELQSERSNNENAAKEIIQKLEQERDEEVARLNDELQNRDNEIQKLISDRENVVQNNLQNQQSEFESQNASLMTQIASLQNVLEQGKLSHLQAFEEQKKSYLEQQKVSDEVRLELTETKEKLEAEVERLTNETSGKDSQLTNLTAKIVELNSAIDEMKANYDAMSNVGSQAQAVESALHEAQQQLQSSLNENAHLCNELQTMKRELELSESQKNEIWTERNSIHNELLSLRQSHEALLGEVGSLRRQLQEKESPNDDASNKIIHELNGRIKELSSKEQSWFQESQRFVQKISDCQKEVFEANDRLEKLSSENHNLKVSFEEKCHDLEMAKRNIQELTAALDEKSADSLSAQELKTQSLAAIQELQSQLSHARRDRDSAQSRTSDRERELQELKREVNNVIEKKRKLEQELSRLKEHLVGVEESGTQEVLAYEERERELRRKLQTTEDALRLASAHQTSANKEASTHVQFLESKVAELSQERDSLSRKFASLTDQLKKKTAAFQNLEMALAGLQEEKKNEIKISERNYNEMLTREKQRHVWLENEVKVLQQRVQKSDELVAAANSLGEQIAAKNQVITALKQEIKLKDELLHKAQEEFGDKAVNNARFERNLVKNLVVSYFQADAKQKTEVLGLIAKVLGFDEEERIKTGLDGPGFGLRYLRNMMPSSRNSETGKVDVSLAEAFVKFLETESTPKTPIRLPAEEMAEEATRRSRQSSVSSSTPSQQLDVISESTATFAAPKSGSPNPLVMAGNSGSVAMPSLPTFSVNRSSSAILRHVLQEEES